MTKIEMQAMDAVIGIHREMRKANEIDWEQRRYEIAKDVLASSSIKTAVDLLSAGYSIGKDSMGVACAKQAVAMADALIVELKKEVQP